MDLSRPIRIEVEIDSEETIKEVLPVLREVLVLGVLRTIVEEAMDRIHVVGRRVNHVEGDRLLRAALVAGAHLGIVDGVPVTLQ